MTVKELIMELLELDMNAEIEIKTNINDDILYFPISQVDYCWSCAYIKSDDLDTKIKQLYEIIGE